MDEVEYINMDTAPDSEWDKLTRVPESVKVLANARVNDLSALATQLTMQLEECIQEQKDIDD